MATSNRDRIGQMFDALAPALNEFITQAVMPALPTGAQSWTAVMAAVDNTAGTTKEYGADDPQVQLKMISQNYTGRYKRGWFPFRGTLSRVHEAYAGELLDVRNAWAHMKPFSDDDAYRALDTGERLLAAINAPRGAETVAQIRTSLRRVTADKDDKRTLKSAVDNPDAHGLQPWREVLRPHDEVATGQFQAAEFAADLYRVATGADTARDYADPTEFFARTYLTTGLQDLIGRAIRRLSGDDNASPVINLQTNFGGGKTHSMLSLWHLAGGQPLGSFPQDVQELLSRNGYDGIPQNVRRVAIVGNHTSASGSQKQDGTTVNTLWGELAWQLGGAEAYALVAQSDRDRTPPGAALHTLLAQYTPAVILIDEWVAYARSLLSRDDLAGGTFDDQFTFAQSLTEAVKGTSGVLLAISIPASESGDDEHYPAGNAEEVGGSHGLEALRRLQNVVRRVADQWRPASSEEAYHIVRQRLFVTPDASAFAAMKATAKAYVEMYRKHSDDFPSECRDSTYEDRIYRTFPIHPELFDRLYEDWSGLERFQRTRGVLRLMNTVIHALWQGEDASPLIMPGSIPLATAAVNSELTQYLTDVWKPIIDADVDGPNSEPAKIDTAKPLYGQRSTTKRLARTVFFGSAPTIGAAHKGIERQRVFLGTAVPGDVPGNFHSALTQLGDRATYFYSGSGKFWYDTHANITRRAKDQAERLHNEDVWAEIARRLQQQARTRGNFAGVHVCPEENADIPDIDEARLVILHPKVAHKRNTDSDAVDFAVRATEQRGSANRTNRNMVVFLAADQDRLADLNTAVRDYLGWSVVMQDADSLDLTQNQKNQAAEKRVNADRTVEDRLLIAYQWILQPTAQPGEPFTIGVTKIEGGQTASLAERVSKRMGNDGTLNLQQSAQNVALWLHGGLSKLWARGHIRIADLWAIYAQYPYMPRLRDEFVLLDGTTDQPLLWEGEGFAVADSYDETADRYQGLTLPTDAATPTVTDTTLIVRPDVAKRQRAAEVEADAGSGVSDTAGETGMGAVGARRTPDTASEPGKPLVTRFFGSTTMDPDRYGSDFKKLHDEILAPLAAAAGVRLTLRLEIEAVTPEGFDEHRVRTVSENAAVMKFEQASFEET